MDKTSEDMIEIANAYLAKQILGLSGEEAINWVRQYIDRAVETNEQRQLIEIADFK